MLFFDTIDRIMLHVYTDVCLYDMGDFYHSEVGLWNYNIIDQANVFRALEEEKQLLLPLNHKLPKDPNNLSINLHEVEAILLLFQTWTWC